MGLSQSTEIIIRFEGSLPSSFANRYFDCQKTKGAGFEPPREAARSFNSLEFALRFGSGSPLPRINAASCAGYRTFAFRVSRRKYWSLTRSGPTNRRLCTWRRSAAISSNVLCLSCPSSLKFSSSWCASHLSRELACINYQ